MGCDENDILLVTEEEEGERLDKILAARFKGVYSRTYFQYLIDEELVLLNGEVVKKRIKPVTGDEIEVEFAQTPEIQLQAENIPFSILYEDEFLIAINKPAGMVVHPSPGHYSGTFVHGLLYHCGFWSEEENSLRPGIVHRLDKDTSGVLVAAKTRDAQHKLIEMFASRQIYKEYWTVCVGRPPDGEIATAIGRHPVHRKQMAVVSSGKQAISIVHTLGGNERLSFVKVVILTGRTHQIRVHLKYKNAPILGDALYGNSAINHSYGVDRQLLHAAILRFCHPMTGESLALHAPPPADMIPFMNKFLGEKAIWDLSAQASKKTCKEEIE